MAAPRNEVGSHTSKQIELEPTNTSSLFETLLLKEGDKLETAVPLTCFAIVWWQMNYVNFVPKTRSFGWERKPMDSSDWDSLKDFSPFSSQKSCAFFRKMFVLISFNMAT